MCCTVTDAFTLPTIFKGFPGGAVVKNPPAKAGDKGEADSIPGLGGSLGGENGLPIPACLPGKSHGGGAWLATVHGVAKEHTTEHTHTVFNSRKTLGGCYYCPNFQTRT